MAKFVSLVLESDQGLIYFFSVDITFMFGVRWY